MSILFSSENLEGRELEKESQPFLFRFFTFFLKEFPSCFKEEKGLSDFRVVKLADGKIKFKFSAIPFSCNRFVVTKKTSLLVNSCRGWRPVRFSDFSHLFIFFNNFLNCKTVFRVKDQLDKLEQQARYNVFISRYGNYIEKKIDPLIRNKTDFLFHKDRRIFSFIFLDCLGVIHGHLDHPSPYPYQNSLSTNLLGVDPFLSFFYFISKHLNRQEFGFNDMSLQEVSKNDFPFFGGNRTRFLLINKNLFQEILHKELLELSEIFFRSLNLFCRNDFSYDADKFFLIPIPEIEVAESGLGEFLLDSKYSLPTFSTSSGRSVFVPVITGVDKKNFLYLKTSWPNIVKTSLTRGLSLSKIRWFELNSLIYEGLKSSFFTFMRETHFFPKDSKKVNLFFIKRETGPIVECRDHEYVVPLIGLVTPNKFFFEEGGLINYFFRLGGEKFLKKLISCITDSLVFQLLNKGVFHGLHLQNCCLLLWYRPDLVLPKKIIIRDGDIRICKDYMKLFTEKEKMKVGRLIRKKGKINCKKTFYKYFFHNIINENFGNIEMCLLKSGCLKSEEYWKLVVWCFEGSLKKNKKLLKREKRFGSLQQKIVADFRHFILEGDGYSANFLGMDYFGLKEDFVKVKNPLKEY